MKAIDRPAEGRSRLVWASLRLEMVFELVAGRRHVADAALVNGADMSLQHQRLDIVCRGYGGRYRVRAAVAGGAHDLMVPARVAVELARLLEGEFLALVARPATRLVLPRTTRGISHLGHAAVAVRTADAALEVDIALAVGLEARMTRVAAVREVGTGHARRMGRVHRAGKGVESRFSGQAQRRLSVACAADHGLRVLEIGAVHPIVGAEDVRPHGGTRLIVADVAADLPGDWHHGVGPGYLRAALKHLELAEAMYVIRKSEPQRAVLTHLYPDWDGIDFEAEIPKGSLKGEVLQAFDGLRVETS